AADRSSPRRGVWGRSRRRAVGAGADPAGRSPCTSAASRAFSASSSARRSRIVCCSSFIGFSRFRDLTLLTVDPGLHGAGGRPSTGSGQALLAPTPATHYPLTPAYASVADFQAVPVNTHSLLPAGSTTIGARPVKAA